MIFFFLYKKVVREIQKMVSTEDHNNHEQSMLWIWKEEVNEIKIWN